VPGGPRGSLQVESIPSGGRVAIDGEARGTTPLRVDDLAPGEHLVIVQSSVNLVERRVTVYEGSATMLDVPLSGGLALSSPVPLKVYDRGRFVGDAPSVRLELAAGLRRIEVENDALSYREIVDVLIHAGRTTHVQVTPPDGVLHLTADNRVAVTLDGRAVGTTPVGALAVSPGEHRVTFAHPRLGEQTYTVFVTTNSSSRLHAEFGPPPPPSRRSVLRPPVRR
jgi:hypothetical protein